ncbi:MAG: hypothetical protein GEU75_11170 [Dehalococcoidia bacterium]|nr:hypothetical protein [Dehalococcoidia bacterium]
MSIDARLNKLMPTLSAKERAILILESWKDDKPEDPSWRWSMPPGQASEFNRYIALMNGANLKIGTIYILLIEQFIDKLELRFAWYVALKLWEEQIDDIQRIVQVTSREPITESDYEAEVSKIREEWVPVTELAGFLAGQRTDWAETDWEAEDEFETRDVTDAAWDREVKVQERRLRTMVESREIRALGKGRSLKLQMSSFDDAFGRTTTAIPQDLLRYRIIPDRLANDVEEERHSQEAMLATLEWERIGIVGNPPGAVNVRQRLMDALRTSLSACFSDYWHQLRAVEIVVEEIAVEFDGVDPLRPAHRSMLDACHAKLLKSQEELQYLELEAIQSEPDDELIDTLRGLAQS